MIRHGRFLIIALLLIACLGAAQSTPAAFAQGFPVTITDDAGRTVTIQSEPSKIVSLGPSNTEILFAVGLGDKVVGVTMYCDYPPQVKRMVEEGKITIIGGLTTPNIEMIIGLDPDLVVGHNLMGEDNLNTLEGYGIPVLILDPKEIDGIYDDIIMVGNATGSSEAAASLVNVMKGRIDAVEKAISIVEESAKVKVVHMCWLEPIWVSGSETFINAVIEKAGGINVFSDISGYAPVSAEAVIAKNPDVIIYTSMGLEVSGEEKMAEIKGLFEPANAVKNNRVYLLIGDAASMLERAAPGIVDGIETLAKIFYPSIYGGPIPHVITERTVSVPVPRRVPIQVGYSEGQVEAVEEAKTVLSTEGDVKEAYNLLVKTGVIITEIPSIEKDSQFYILLTVIYGENLERYPTPEGRIQLLYAMGKLKVEVEQS